MIKESKKLPNLCANYTVLSCLVQPYLSPWQPDSLTTTHQPYQVYHQHYHGFSYNKPSLWLLQHQGCSVERHCQNTNKYCCRGKFGLFVPQFDFCGPSKSNSKSIEFELNILILFWLYIQKFWGSGLIFLNLTLHLCLNPRASEAPPQHYCDCLGTVIARTLRFFDFS